MASQTSSTACKTCVVYAAFIAVAFAAAPARAVGDDFDHIIDELAAQYRVEPALVKAVIRAESGFDPRAVSPKGARGLMQLTPRTARHHGVANLQDPRQNIRGGVRLLRLLLDRFNDDAALALAAYNAGGPTVERYGGVPPYSETRRYVAAVLRFREQYRRLEPGYVPAGPERTPTQIADADARRLQDAWPRRAETMLYGADQAGALRAALHSPERRLDAEPSHRSDVP
jgi:soluble lytic murein transglycosylase-like protein